MTFFGATLLTAIATVVLAVFAIVTAWYARKAFIKQSQEVADVERQIANDQEVTRQQARLLDVQTRQLGVLRRQLEDQLKASAAQAVVLDLQAKELRESLDQRKREAEERRRAQAAKIFLNQAPTPKGMDFGEGPPPSDTVTVVNSSDQPVYDGELHWPAMSQQDNPGRHRFGTVMPGDTVRHKVPPGTGASLWFRDAAGIKWVLKPDGGLSEQW